MLGARGFGNARMGGVHGARSALDCSSLLELLWFGGACSAAVVAGARTRFPTTGSKLPPPQSSSKLEHSKALRAPYPLPSLGLNLTPFQTDPRSTTLQQAVAEALVN